MKKNIIFFILYFCLSFVIFSQENTQIKIIVSAKYLNNESTWFIPLNARNNKVALFSEQREAFTILNDSQKPVTIKSLDLQLDPGVQEEEIRLQQYSIKALPLNFVEKTLQPKQRLEFYVRFYPVQSHLVKAKIIIQFGDTSKFILKVEGQGGLNAFFPDMIPLLHKVFGGTHTDEMVTGMTADKEGNVFFSGQVIGVQDKFAYDIFYGKISPDGNLVWAKLWHGPYRDAARDSGQNDETGGTSGAICVDEEGFPYIIGSVSPNKANNDFAALVIKIDPSTGNSVWEKLWRPEWPGKILAKHCAEAYAIDVRNGRVYVTGTTGGATHTAQALVFLLSLSSKDGTLLFQKTIDPTPTYNDRGYAVRSDNQGNVYVAGLASQNAFLVKFTNADTQNPQIAWAKICELGWGSNINCLDLDAQGNVYISCDRRGAQTFFSVIKISHQGEFLWGKTYDGGPNKNNNTNFVKVIHESVYAGGRTGQSMYDAQMGDAQLLKLSCKDGKEEWSLFHFSGKGPDEIAEHRIKGIAIAKDILYILGQVYTGNNNGVRYAGYWYKGTGTLSDFKPTITSLEFKEKPADISKGKLMDALQSRKLLDLKSLIPWQDADKKHDGKSPDGDLIYWQIKLKKQ